MYYAGSAWDRDEDHLAMMQELMGSIPDSVINNNYDGNKISYYFNNNGKLKHIENLRYWNIYDILIEKYKFHYLDAKEISDFLEPMLQLDPSDRVTAFQCLQSQWLNDINTSYDRYDNRYEMNNYYDSDEDNSIMNDNKNEDSDYYDSCDNYYSDSDSDEK